VILGGTIGHSLCTGLAVMGGRFIAQRISIRTGEDRGLVVQRSVVSELCGDWMAYGARGTFEDEVGCA
jgi:hypothetical protein